MNIKGLTCYTQFNCGHLTVFIFRRMKTIMWLLDYCVFRGNASIFSTCITSASVGLHGVIPGQYCFSINDENFRFLLIGLNATFLGLPQSEFTSHEPLQRSIRVWELSNQIHDIFFRSANQITCIVEHSVLCLLLR